MNKIFYFLRFGLKTAQNQWYFQLARCAFYIVVIGSWAYVWTMATPEIWDKIGLTWPRLVWYIAIAELLPFSTTNSHRLIENDLREGRFSMHLSRPFSWFTSFYIQEWGAIPFNIIWAFITCVTFAFLMTGEIPLTPLLIAQIAVHFLLASLIWVAMLTFAGMTALWLRTSSLAYFVLHKGGFVLGGLLLPLTLYPDWLKVLAFMTPFPALYYVTGQTILGNPAMSFGAGVAYQTLVLAIIMILTWLMYKLFEQKLLQE